MKWVEFNLCHQNDADMYSLISWGSYLRSGEADFTRGKRADSILQWMGNGGLCSCAWKSEMNICENRESKDTTKDYLQDFTLTNASINGECHQAMTLLLFRCESRAHCLYVVQKAANCYQQRSRERKKRGGEFQGLHKDKLSSLLPAAVWASPFQCNENVQTFLYGLVLKKQC